MAWVLRLNPMMSNAETCSPIAVADTKEQLEAFLTAEAVEPYQDGQWHKVFRQGGKLEWFNPPMNGQAFYNVPAIFDIGTEQDWAAQAIQQYQQITNSLFRV